MSVCVYVCRFAETLTLSEKNTNYLSNSDWGGKNVDFSFWR